MNTLWNVKMFAQVEATIRYSAGQSRACILRQNNVTGIFNSPQQTYKLNKPNTTADRATPNKALAGKNPAEPPYNERIMYERFKQRIHSTLCNLWQDLAEERHRQVGIPR
jgi:hypothetical protein